MLTLCGGIELEGESKEGKEWSRIMQVKFGCEAWIHVSPCIHFLTNSFKLSKTSLTPAQRVVLSKGRQFRGTVASDYLLQLRFPTAYRCARRPDDHYTHFASPLSCK